MKSSVLNQRLKSISNNNLQAFNVLHHPASLTHIARTSYTRLQQDISNYITDENTNTYPVLKFISELNNSNDKANIEVAVQRMMELGASLKRIKEKDLNYLKIAIPDIKNCINKRLTNDTKSLTRKRLTQSLFQRAGIEPTLVLFIYIYMFMTF
jgi:hypothetical protein